MTAAVVLVVLAGVAGQPVTRAGAGARCGLGLGLGGLGLLLQARRQALDLRRAKVELKGCDYDCAECQPQCASGAPSTLFLVFPRVNICGDVHCGRAVVHTARGTRGSGDEGTRHGGTSLLFVKLL